MWWHVSPERTITACKQRRDEIANNAAVESPGSLKDDFKPSEGLTANVAKEEKFHHGCQLPVNAKKNDNDTWGVNRSGQYSSPQHVTDIQTTYDDEDGPGERHQKWFKNSLLQSVLQQKEEFFNNTKTSKHYQSDHLK